MYFLYLGFGTDVLLAIVSKKFYDLLKLLFYVIKYKNEMYYR